MNTKITVIEPLTKEGKDALDVVKDVVQRFCALDISTVENACNETRRQFVAMWKENTKSRIERYAPLVVAIKEAEPKFKLVEPERISLAIAEQGDAVRFTAPQSSIRPFTIYTILKWVSHFQGTLYVIDPQTGEPTITLRESTVHELLHVCGDWEPNGNIRQTLLGVTAVYPLLYQTPPPTVLKWIDYPTKVDNAKETSTR